MLAGAGPAPTALLVVAADDGWSAQTEEHVEVLDLLGVPGVAVALTKVDVVDPARADEVEHALTARLAGTSLEGAPIVRTAAPSGEGIAELAGVLAARLASLAPPSDHGRPRLWVDRVFPVRGAGTVVTGTLGGGSLRVGDKVRVLPAGREARVRGVQSLGHDVEVAPAGTRVALNLAGIGRDEVHRGSAVVAGGPWRVTSRVDAVVRALPGRRIERAGAWRLHAGSASVVCRVLPITDPVASGEVGAVRLLLDAPLPLVAGDRLVLREAGRQRTMGGGQVADPDTGPPPRGRPAREARVAGLAAVAGAAGPDEALRALLALSGGARRGPAALAAAGLPTDGPRPDGVVAVGGHAVLDEVWQRWTAAAVAAAAESGVAGSAVDRERFVAAAAAAGAPSAVAEAIPDALVREGRLVRRPGGLGVAEPGGTGATTGEVGTGEASGAGGAGDAGATGSGGAAGTGASGAVITDERESGLLAALREDPFSPPDLTTTARALGIDHRGVNRLVQAGLIVRAGDVAFAADAVADAVDHLVALEAEVGPFTAAQAKTAWGTTRRFAIPLLEHLDATRVTAFDGRLRTLTGRRPAGAHRQPPPG
jgi:selenocysteine-specific elongation factor